MTEFTPLSALAGGGLIGLSAALLLLGGGRIAGISSIVGGAVQTPAAGGWRWSFLVGLLLGTVVFQWLGGDTSAIRIEASDAVLIAGGLLVGLGTRLGGGCTSGHGVCGLSRFSVRSLVAVVLFMGTAALVVYVSRHVLGGGL